MPNGSYTAYDNGNVRVDSSTYEVGVTITGLPSNAIIKRDVSVVNYFGGLTGSTNTWKNTHSTYPCAPADFVAQLVKIGIDMKQIYISSVYTVKAWYATSKNIDGTYNPIYIDTNTDRESKYGKLIE